MEKTKREKEKERLNWYDWWELILFSATTALIWIFIIVYMVLGLFPYV